MFVDNFQLLKSPIITTQSIFSNNIMFIDRFFIQYSIKTEPTEIDSCIFVINDKFCDSSTNSRRVLNSMAAGANSHQHVVVIRMIADDEVLVVVIVVIVTSPGTLQLQKSMEKELGNFFQ